MRSSLLFFRVRGLPFCPTRPLCGGDALSRSGGHGPPFPDAFPTTSQTSLRAGKAAQDSDGRVQFLDFFLCPRSLLLQLPDCRGQSQHGSPRVGILSAKAASRGTLHVIQAKTVSEIWRDLSPITVLLSRAMRKRGRFQNKVGAAAVIGTSWAHSWSSFSGRFTRLPTGYFFISLGSNGLRQSATRSGSVIPGSSQRS